MGEIGERKADDIFPAGLIMECIRFSELEQALTIAVILTRETVRNLRIRTHMQCVRISINLLPTYTA